MVSGGCRSYTEPDEFAKGILGAKVDLAILLPGHFDARISTIHLNSFRMQRIAANLPLISHMRNLGGRTSFIFHTQPGQSMMRDGDQVSSDSMVRVGSPQSHFHRSSGPINWGVISIPLENVPAVATAGFDLTPPPRDLVITPRIGALATLQRLHQAAALVAAEAPELLANPEAVRGMEQVLMQALVDCLDSDNVHDKTPAQRRHHKIMQRFHTVLKGNPERPLYVLEMAEAVGASLRSLSVCCQEHLGMGPKKYLLLRRMHLARQALSLANPSMSTVTDVATQYGFWQFGRFAGQYKLLFGEPPSATLRRPRSG
jgi:AraC-like DNA-binding protein